MTASWDPWRVVVPVKRAESAKRRLTPPPPLTRVELARAMARDTVEAVCAAVGGAQVVVVTSDHVTARVATSLGAVVVPDSSGGLNAAVGGGLAHARREQPDAYVAVVLGDLPALQPSDLQAGLTACAGYDRAVVPDADGTGTVLLTAAPGRSLHPRFGTGSAARHAEDARRLDLDLPRLRRDVDDVDSLAQAALLGVGRHTAALLARGALAERNSA